MSPLNLIGARSPPCLALLILFLLSLVRQPAPQLLRPQELVVADATNYKAKNFAPEAQRAISTTKTSLCQLELTKFVNERVKQPLHGIDSKPNQVGDTRAPQELGCLLSAPNESTTLVAIDHGRALDNTFTRESCPRACFSYGHNYAAHHLSDMTCHCGNQLSRQNLITDPNVECTAPGRMLCYKLTTPLRRSTRPDRSNASATGSPIRIAFLLSLNGRSVLQVRRLLKMIYERHHIYYLHTDGRQHYLFERLLPLERQRDNILLAKERLNTIWGGSSLLRMMLAAMLRLSRHRWDYLINLSESDLPLKSVAKLADYLGAHSRSTIYLKAHNMTGYKFIKKQGLDQTFYQCEDRMWRLGKRQLPTDITYSGGSDWFALPSSFCDFILRERDNPNGIVKRLLNLYNYTLLPAESFFHTLALNTEFSNHLVDNNLRLTNWYRKRDCGCQHKDVVDWCGCSPVIYRWSDLKRLQQTRSVDFLFFSRKFDPTVSSSIIGAVEHHLVADRSWETPQLDTRFWLNVWISEAERADEVASLIHAQFGLFGLAQLPKDVARLVGRRMSSLELFFNYDRFIGVILKYDRPLGGSSQLLLERNTSVHLKYHNPACSNGTSRPRLKVIEVNHGFDTGERIFRNHLPLDSRSNLVVYHEWLVRDLADDRGPSGRDKVRFHWKDPGGRVKLAQEAKLTTKSAQEHLYFAHKFNIEGPLDSGVWQLTVSVGPLKCLDYQFLIFNETSFSAEHVSQDQFNRFYTVTEACASSMDSTALLRDCDGFEWSMEAKNRKLDSYDLE